MDQSLMALKLLNKKLGYNIFIISADKAKPRVIVGRKATGPNCLG